MRAKSTTAMVPLSSSVLRPRRKIRCPDHAASDSILRNAALRAGAAGAGAGRGGDVDQRDLLYVRRRRNYECDAFGNRTGCMRAGSDCQFGMTINTNENRNRLATATYDSSGNVTG